MKKYIFIILAVVFAVTFTILPAAATETDFDTIVELETIAEGEEVSFVADTSVEEITVMDESEIESFAVIDGSMSLSEVILAIAERCGISVEEAEKMVTDIRVIGDRYLGGNDLWLRVTEDMEEHPAKWTLFGVLILIVLFLIGVLIKRVISDAVSTQRMKVALERIDEAINGDEKDENGRALSIRAMINEKNGHIDLLEKENGELKAKTEELTQVIDTLKTAIGKVEVNSDTSLKLTEETMLRVIQLINIAMDRKIPLTSKEFRDLWYTHTQGKIKEIYEEGSHGGEAGTVSQA